MSKKISDNTNIKAKANFDCEDHKEAEVIAEQRYGKKFKRNWTIKF